MGPRPGAGRPKIPFTDDDDRKLLRHVRNNPELFDPDHKKYTEYNSRELAWQKIGDEMRMPASDCKMRWAHMRDAYRRQIKLKSTENGVSNKLYKYHREMSFMKPIYKDVTFDDRDTTDNVDTDDIDGGQYDDGEQSNEEKYNNDLEETIYYHESEEQDSEPSTSATKRKRKPLKRKIKQETDGPRNLFVDSSAISIQLYPTDPVDSFLLTMGTVLRNLSPCRLNLAKTKLFAVVQEEELQELLEKQNQESQIR